jgi:hypothetical protein
MRSVVFPVSENVPSQPRPDDKPHVEIVDGPLCSASDLRDAVIAGAITSGLVCALAGFGFGFWMGLRGREG